MKKACAFLLLTALCTSLCSCWDYGNITEINIVSGVAVDVSDTPGNYIFTFEIANVAAGPEELAASIYAETEAPTFFEAVCRSKSKLASKFYLGNMQVMIISREIAENEGLFSFLDALLRGGEPRETISLLVSSEPTASEILRAHGLDIKNLSQELRKILEDDAKLTSGTKSTQLHQAYNAVTGEGAALVLPAVCFGEGSDPEEKVVTVNGVALLPHGRLAGFLTPGETRMFLAATDGLRGGSFSFEPSAGGAYSASMEIKKSGTEILLDCRGGFLKITLDIKADMAAAELSVPAGVPQSEVISRLEEQSAGELRRRVLGIVRRAQAEYGADIFSFGNLLYRENPGLWAQVRDDWDEMFRGAEIEVRAAVSITSIGIISAERGRE